MTVSEPVRSIAFYLPQFHPIPENDSWWGNGFTEWRNVAKARPLFRGHDQPHVPADFGYYDLRLPEIRAAQAAMAKTYGIHGFCYYHYWFNGKRLLDRPFREVLTSGSPDLPFCLAWANENWTRAWDGGERELLMEQHYSLEDDREHVRALIPAFRDRRYIRYEGKPVFLVYRASRLPDPLRTTEIWRHEAMKGGLPGLHLLRVESFDDEIGDPTTMGFDAAVDFQPKWRDLSPHPAQRLHDKLNRRRLTRFRSIEYSKLVRTMLEREKPGYKRWPCVTPRWDNSARRRRGAFLVRHPTPQMFGYWLEREVEGLAGCAGRDTPLLFVNAWNEWGEGCHLEPDERWGHAFLEAHRNVMRGRHGRSSEYGEGPRSAG